MGRLDTTRAEHHDQYVLNLPCRAPTLTRAHAYTWLYLGISYDSVSDCADYIPPALRLVYRVNTFPLIHKSLLHAFFNILALTPLLERFETEFGTLTSLALFFGRECPDG